MPTKTVVHGTRPTDVLNIQVEQLRWWRSASGVKFAQGFIDSTRAKEHQNGMFPASWTGDQLAALETLHLNSATTYVVTAPMVELGFHAAQTMKPQPLKNSDLPSPSGFMWLDNSIHILDVRGIEVGIGCVMWTPTRFSYPDGTQARGIQVSFYTKKNDPKDEDMKLMRAEYSEEQWQKMPPLILFHVDSWVFEQTWEQEKLDIIETEPRWEESGQLPSFEERLTRPKQFNDELRRFLQSSWTLMQQRLAVTETHSPDRAMRRRMERTSPPTPIKDVKVIVLRRANTKPQVDDGHEPSPVFYSHRFLVDGHWHFYHFKEGPRQLWVNPYVKGSEQLPLIVKEKIYHFRR